MTRRRAPKESIVRENSWFIMFERVIPGKTSYVIFRKTSTCLEEVKTMRGGGHTTAMHANNEFDRLTCVEIYKAGHLTAKPGVIIGEPNV